MSLFVATSEGEYIELLQLFGVLVVLASVVPMESNQAFGQHFLLVWWGRGGLLKVNHIVYREMFWETKVVCALYPVCVGVCRGQIKQH